MRAERIQTGMKSGEHMPPLRAVGLLEYGVGGELILCEPNVEHVHFLNATAAAIWLLCDGRHTEADIAAELAALFNLEVPGVESDVRGTLVDFLTKGLLRAPPGYNEDA